MKNKRLLDLIEHIDQAYVAEAAPKKRGTGLMWQRWGAVAAAFVLLVGTVIGGYYIFQKNPVNKIPNSVPIAYMDYNGPILPLTAKQELDGITAERQVVYDFSTGKAAVTDRYVLKNTKETSQTISLLYPFGASLSDDLDVLPQMTVDGAAVETTLYLGADCKLKKTGTTGEKVGWNAYQTLLQDGSYQAAAFADYPALNQSIVVYEITNVICHGEGQNPTLNMEFAMDYNKTTVMTYGMNGLKNDVEAGEYSRHFSVAETGSHYLVVLGEDLGAYTLQGYQDGGCDKGEEIEITAKVNRLETTLGAFLQERLAEKRIPNSNGDLRDVVSEEVFFGLVAQHLEEGILAHEGTEKFNYDMFEDIINSAHYAQRVIYIAFDVTIPAGEQITVAGAFVREGHSDYVVSGAKQGNAYDIATQLGSNLVFASQTVSVSGMETLEIKAQNLGLDLKNGITQVTLEGTEAYYWMELQEAVASTEEPTSTDSATEEPRDTHTVLPSETPSAAPTPIPTLTPTKGPTPTKAPTQTESPTTPPIVNPTNAPTKVPTKQPTPTPTPTQNTGTPVPVDGSQGLTYEKIAGGYAVSGIGTCKDTKIKIPSAYNGQPVIAIDGGAFSGCNKITEVVMPDTVTSVGECAFLDCTALKSVTLSKNINTIAYRMFDGCKSLTSVEIPQKVECIKNSAFADSGITAITIGINIKTIESEAFYGSALTTVKFEEGVTEIHKAAFNGAKKLKTVVLPTTLKTIGNDAFSKCPIESITFPNSLQSIGSTAFSGLLVKEVRLPASLKSIETGCFANSGVETVYFSSAVTLGRAAFKNCKSLKTVVLYNGTTEIPSSCFEGCELLENINLPTSLQLVGAKAFWECSALHLGNITINYSVEDMAFSGVNFDTLTISTPVISYNAYKEIRAKKVVLAEGVREIGESAFSHGFFDEISFPSSLTTVGRTAFYFSKVKEMEFKSAVALGWQAFKNCQQLKSVTLLDGTSISCYIFDGCTALETIYYGGTMAKWKSLIAYPNYGSSSSALEFFDDIRIICSDGEI